MSITWDEASARLGRNDFPHAMATHWWRFDDVSQRQALNAAWCMAEWPLSAAPADFWLDLFRAVLENGTERSDGVLVDAYLHDDWLNERDSLPETTALFRGVTHPDAARGMSWTASPDRADWFARRLGGLRIMRDGTAHKGEPIVVCAEVPREAVLARFDGRSEDEYVVDPDLLPDRLYTLQPWSDDPKTD